MGRASARRVALHARKGVGLKAARSGFSPTGCAACKERRRPEGRPTGERGGRGGAGFSPTGCAACKERRRPEGRPTGRRGGFDDWKGVGLKADPQGTGCAGSWVGLQPDAFSGMSIMEPNTGDAFNDSVQSFDGEKPRRSRPGRHRPARPGSDAGPGQPLSARHEGGGRRRLGASAARARDRAREAGPHDRHRAARPHDHRAQRLARHPVHAVDQSVPGMRARLHLLLCPPVPRLPRPVAGARLRDEALREAGRGEAPARGAREARLPVRPDRAGHQHRPVPADRARMEGDAFDPRGARRDAASVLDRHQERAGRARPRPDRADGGGGARARLPVDHDARRGPRAEARAAGERARTAPSRRCARWRVPACRRA